VSLWGKRKGIQEWVEGEKGGSGERGEWGAESRKALEAEQRFSLTGAAHFLALLPFPLYWEFD
jgi:hypothetical protein